MSITRSQHKPRAYFDEMLEYSNRRHTEKDQWELYRRKNFEIDSGDITFGNLTNSYCQEFAGDIPKMFTRGDDPESIYDSRGKHIMDRYLRVAQEITDQGYIGQRFFESNTIDVHGFHHIYTLLCLFYCFGIDDKKMQVIAPVLFEEGKDRLIDKILQRWQPARKIAAGSGHPATFQLLDDFIDAGQIERIDIIHTYIKNWAKLLSNLKSPTIGLSRRKKLSKNEDLEKDVTGMYVGFWMWEVALLVKAFDIDDSSFSSNEFYPKEMVDYLR